jgi:methionine synthase II (cobalamin-independent)
MKDNKANGVIIGLTSKVSQQDAFQSFLMNDKPVLTPSNLDVSMRIEYDNVKEELSKAKHDYEKVLNNAINELEELAKAEIKIIQLRCLLNIEPKLGILKQKRKEGSITYLTARATFFDPSIKRSEVKVYLGELKNYGTNIKEIEKKQTVIDEARIELFELMRTRMRNKTSNPSKVKDFKFFSGTK